jgi:hypothetical protein
LIAEVNATLNNKTKAKTIKEEQPEPVLIKLANFDFEGLATIKFN